ncbi:protein of unknown function [Agreia sp. COWG]|nr:protein of unknown function [Agreia sp. COWG]
MRDGAGHEGWPCGRARAHIRRVRQTRASVHPGPRGGRPSNAISVLTFLLCGYGAI